MKNVLITGSTGMLGSDFVRTFSKDTHYRVYGLSRQRSPLLPESRQILIDLSKSFEADQISIRPDVIIHTAALTDLNFCEKNPDMARQVHVEASRKLRHVLSENGTFVYISTDSVFDGTKGNYLETDVPNPLNKYALTKLQGEQAVQQVSHGRTSIIRTNIYGFHRPLKSSLAEWAYREWKEGRTISGFTDIAFNAVYTQQLVSIIKFLIDEDLRYPVLNVASNEAISKYDFLDKLRDRLKVDRHLLAPAESERFPSAIQRPKDTTLNPALLATFHALPEFDEGISRWIDDLRHSGDPD
jgi:dTDP-4-dehydrorhamnose reductase